MKVQQYIMTIHVRRIKSHLKTNSVRMFRPLSIGAQNHQCLLWVGLQQANAKASNRDTYSKQYGLLRQTREEQGRR